MQTINLETITDLFSRYLEDNQLRKTKERFAILEIIYTHQHHFDADSLYKFLRERNYSISRATVYNTLELLVACGLVRKHYFGEGTARYERAYGSRQHDHLICRDCGEVLEFCDPRIHEIQTTIGKLLNFRIEDRSLTIFGTCKDPQCTNRKKEVIKS